MKTKNKKIIIAFLVIGIIFSGICYMFLFFSMLSSRPEIYYKQVPLDGVGRIVIDNDENIYLQISSHSVVQVYDNNGDFLYGIFYNDSTRGYSDFIVDAENYIHIYAYKLGKVFVFSDSGLESTLDAESEDVDVEWVVFTGMLQKRDYNSGDDIIYKYHSLGKKVILYDAKTENIIKKIKLDAKKWPWSKTIYFFIIWINGLILSFILRCKGNFNKSLVASDEDDCSYCM